MTTFSFPVNIKVHEPADGLPINQQTGRLAARYYDRLTTADTGTAAGTTVIPLFVAPAGARFYSVNIDVPTNFDNTTGVQVQIGTAANVSLLADTTISATQASGRLTYNATAARVSAAAIALTADTTVQARFVITSTLTAGDIIIWTEVV